MPAQALVDTTDAIRAILERNYEALGWRLGKLELLESEALGSILRGIIQCPCGGTEYFSTIIDPARFTREQSRAIASTIMSGTASPGHLKRDVAEGKLPAMDIDKHAFNGVLL